MMSIDFLITTLIIVVSPGIGVLYTIATGLSRGARASVVAAFGCTLGIVPHMAAAIMGLAALLHTSAIAFQTMKYLGVAYLLYMAWMTLKEHGALKVENQVDQKSVTQVIVHAILINILNPKLSIFFFAFLPQFVSTDEAEPVLRMSELQRRVHADDLRGVRGLRPVRSGGAPARDLAAVRDDLDAAGLRRRLLPRWAPSWRWRIDEEKQYNHHVLTLRSGRRGPRLEGWATPRLRPTLRDATTAYRSSG